MEIFLTLTFREREILDKIEKELRITYNELYKRANSGQAKGHSLSAITFNYWIAEIKEQFNLKCSTRLLRQASTQLGQDYKKFFANPNSTTHPKEIRTAPIIIQIKEHQPGNPKTLPKDYDKFTDFRTYASPMDKWGIRVQPLSFIEGAFEVKFPKTKHAVRIFPGRAGVYFTDLSYSDMQALQFNDEPTAISSWSTYSGTILGSEKIIPALLMDTKFIYLVKDRLNHWKVQIPITNDFTYNRIVEYVKGTLGFIGNIRITRHMNKGYAYKNIYDFNTKIMRLLKEFPDEIAYARFFSHIAKRKGMVTGNREYKLGISRVFIPFKLTVSTVYVPMSYYNSLRFNQLKHVLLYDNLKAISDRKYTKLFGGYVERAIQDVYQLPYGAVRSYVKYSKNVLQITPDLFLPNTKELIFGEQKDLPAEQKHQIRYNLVKSWYQSFYVDKLPIRELPAPGFGYEDSVLHKHPFIFLRDDYGVKIFYDDILQLTHLGHDLVFAGSRAVTLDKEYKESVTYTNFQESLQAVDYQFYDSKMYRILTKNKEISQRFVQLLLEKVHIDYLQPLIAQYSLDNHHYYKEYNSKFDMFVDTNMDDRTKDYYTLTHIDSKKAYYNEKRKYYNYLVKQGVPVKDSILNSISTSLSRLDSEKERLTALLNIPKPEPIEVEPVQMTREELDEKYGDGEEEFNFHPERSMTEEEKAMLLSEIEDRRQEMGLHRRRF